MSLFETHLDTDSRTVYLPELKICGHNCCPSSVPKCCACSDLRPVLETASYPCYVDGEVCAHKCDVAMDRNMDYVKFTYP